jgi:uncharacterized membrane protein (DUF106 family)
MNYKKVEKMTIGLICLVLAIWVIVDGRYIALIFVALIYLKYLFLVDGRERMEKIEEMRKYGVNRSIDLAIRKKQEAEGRLRDVNQTATKDHPPLMQKTANGALVPLLFIGMIFVFIVIITSSSGLNFVAIPLVGIYIVLFLCVLCANRKKYTDEENEERKEERRLLNAYGIRKKSPMKWDDQSKPK